MWNKMIQVIALVSLGRLIWRVAGLPGDPDTAPIGDGKYRLYLVQALRDEAGKHGLPLPEYVFVIFKTAVDHHLNNELAAAWKEYSKLRSLPMPNNRSFDLASVSEVLWHNLGLLRSAMFPAQQTPKRRT